MCVNGYLPIEPDLMPWAAPIGWAHAGTMASLFEPHTRHETAYCYCHRWRSISPSGINAGPFGQPTGNRELAGPGLVAG